ncbi:MAG: DNA repair protein RadA [Flavobacteriales bacterium]|jgi:DNA repair protein RadA/Sms|nr:DNA repair protein RadA [Flavobacteriales bacterium]
MAKIKEKTVFYCNNCGNEFSKWQGQCTYCKEWNTIVEHKVPKKSASSVPQWVQSTDADIQHKPKSLAEISLENELRIELADSEFNRVLGGGMVSGAMVLFGGEPGIGKSTLMLQLALFQHQIKTLYVSGEESERQIKLRADRIDHQNENCMIYTEINTHSILKEAKKHQPQLMIIDSIQTLQSPLVDSLPGTITQIKECTTELMRFAKETGTVIVLIGHLTKDGNIAGPKVLEHMVDVVLQFEGDNKYAYRILRSSKNRFGSTHELGIYEMNQQGLSPVDNPSDLLSNQLGEDLSGSAIAATVEGVRPLMIEVQALVSSAVYGTPQRSTTGFDTRRLNMLLAVLEKKCGFRLGVKDVFLNITGGIKMDDPSMDLAVVAAILSSNEDCAVDKKVAFCGEIGLNGEVRPSRKIDQRILEAQKLGFSDVFVSSYSKIDNPDQYHVKINYVSSVLELYHALF